MIRSLWTFVQDSPDPVDPSRVRRSVTQAAVAPAAEASDELVQELTGDATRELSAAPTASAALVVFSDAPEPDRPATRPPVGTPTSISGPGRPFDVVLDVTDGDQHVVRIPNAPLAGEVIVAVRVFAELGFPAVMDLRGGES